MFESYLPQPPPGYHYEEDRVSPLICKIWLVRDEYSQLLERYTRSIYCFIKGKRKFTVHKPKNSKDMYVKQFCELVDLRNQPPYSLFIPKVTSLLHIL